MINDDTNKRHPPLKKASAHDYRGSSQHALHRTKSLPMVLKEKDAGKPLFWFRPRRFSAPSAAKTPKKKTGPTAPPPRRRAPSSMSSNCPTAATSSEHSYDDEEGDLLSVISSDDEKEEDCSTTSVDDDVEECLFGLSLIADTSNRGHRRKS